MALNPEQQREANQLLLVAREYLRIVNLPQDVRQSQLGVGADAFARPVIAEAEWEHTLHTAHLASAPVRLAALEELLEETKTGTRNVHSSCRAYFKKDSYSTEKLSTQGPRWLHVLLRDGIGHIEPWMNEGEDPQQQTRYRERLQYFGATTLEDMHERLSATASELSEILMTAGVSVPIVGP